MTVQLIVLYTSAALPHDQSLHDQPAAREPHTLLPSPDIFTGHHHDRPPQVIAAGIGKIVATAGGHQTVSLMRFLEPELLVHAGDTVEWDNDDPITPHT